MDSLLQRHLVATLSHHTSNRFDEFIRRCQAQYDRPVHTMTEMRLRQNKKLRGDLFEDFCVRYLVHIYPVRFQHVWLFVDIPDVHRTHLTLTHQDNGIDVVALDEQGRYYAIQVKYRKRRPEQSKQFVTWKQLSTFYSLAYRIGKFHRHIVMTNVDGVRHVTAKTRKDQSLCYRRFAKMSWFDWKAMVNSTPPPPPTYSYESVRQQRLAYYNKKLNLA